jgi:hypothetical protein
MTDRSARRPDGGDGLRIGRRGFLGAGLAGAGAAVVGPTAAAAARSHAPKAHGTAVPAAPTADAGGGGISQIPLRSSFAHLPAVPLDTAAVFDTLPRLAVRADQIIQAKQGLTKRFTIHGRTGTAYSFLFGHTSGAGPSGTPLSGRLARQSERAASELMVQAVRNGASAQATTATSGRTPTPLQRPTQFSISWTTFPNVYDAGRPSLSTWAATLTDPEVATEQFWPTIANHGIGYNLIIPRRVRAADLRALAQRFRGVWTRRFEMAARAGNLYVIDMSRFEALQPHSTNGATRFTPSTVTLLTRNPTTQTLTPVAITVSGYKGSGRAVYSRANATDGAWLYALQAAKTSITVFGVWLGHVYHWHIVTAAMQMTMFNTLPPDHPIYELVAPQSKFLIAFDDVLLGGWSQIAPPTSLASGLEFLQLADDYAAGRSYFDDDPKETLSRLGLREAEFTHETAWDRYPVVQGQLAVWDMVAAYVKSCVRASYRSDAAVAGDHFLQAWMAASSASSGGNIRGLPGLNRRAALERVLTSLLYRVTIHGIARLMSTANPALTFVANFPHCLQRSNIPSPRTRVGTQTLLTYLPNTETIGEAVNFYFTFAFSTPYEPFIPLGGADTELFFPGGPGDVRNRALIKLRNQLAAFMDDYQPDPVQRFQWPRNIET